MVGRFVIDQLTKSLLKKQKWRPHKIPPEKTKNGDITKSLLNFFYFDPQMRKKTWPTNETLLRKKEALRRVYEIPPEKTKNGGPHKIPPENVFFVLTHK